MMNSAPPPPPSGVKARKTEEKTFKKAGKVILILGRYAFPFHDWIDQNHTIVLFTPPETEASLDSIAKRKYSLIKYFNNFETNGNVEIEVLKLFRSKTLVFTHVIYQAEQDIIRAARIRKALGLPGQSLESAMCFRDKVIMKSYITEHLPLTHKDTIGIPVFSRLKSAIQVVEFVEQHGLPVVVKPVCGMGSMNTHIIKNSSELSLFLSGGLSVMGCLDGPIDYQVEKFITGQMYHLDGFVQEGVVKLIWPSVYVNTCAGFKNSTFLGSYSLSPSNPLTPRLQKFVITVLESMNAPPSYSFHVEVWHTPEDKLVLCEAACRTGGAGVAGVMLQLFEVNLNKASVQAQCMDPITSPLPEHWTQQKLFPSSEGGSGNGNAGWIVVYPSPGTVLSYPKEAPFPYVLEYSHSHITAWSDSRAHCTEALGSFVVSGDTEHQIQQNISNTVSWFLNNIQWKQ